MPSVNHLLCGLAANEKLPTELVDRLIAIADAEVAAHLAVRADLSRAQAVALAARVEESAVHLAYEGRLTAADIDPSARPDAALALLDQGMGRPEWAGLFAADPVVEHREKLAACPGLPRDVVEALIADTDIRVVAGRPVGRTGRGRAARGASACRGPPRGSSQRGNTTARTGGTDQRRGTASRAAVPGLRP